MDQAKELLYLRFFADLHQQLERVRDVDKALWIALRLAREAFGAERACFARTAPGAGPATVHCSWPEDAAWDTAQLGEYLGAGARRPKLPHDLLLARVERFGRVWAALALARARDFDRGDLRLAARAAAAISSQLARLDEARVAEVRARVDRKVLEQLRPKDLFYQILHGLRTLTRYDHSAAILMRERQGALTLVAEQIAWRKGKSLRIGATVPLDGLTLDELHRGDVRGFELVGAGPAARWQGSSGDAFARLADALDYNRKGSSEAAEHAECSMLTAPLATREGVLGVLKIASCRRGALGAWEARLVEGFLPHATAALANMNRTTSLEVGMLEAEKKTVMATIARGVSHDINNAFGSALPLVQQMIADLERGQVEASTLVEDLAQIESSLQVCRRIFGGMLTIARGAGRPLGEGNVRRAIETTLGVLAESMKKHDVEVELALDDELPLVRAGQGDLEQLVLNLATNARDAMPRGGRLEVRTRRVAPGGPGREAPGGVEFALVDSGCGIPAAHMARIREPFFTTKPEGSGLGLSICRSIVWRMQGRLTIESQDGRGTSVTVFLPVREASEAHLLEPSEEHQA